MAPATAAWLIAALHGALCAFQIALAFGAPLGRLAWGGQHRVLPPRLRIASALSIILYAAIALVMLDRAEIIDILPDGTARTMAWVAAVYLALGVPLNLISRSRPERLVMTPTVIVLAVLAFIVATS